MSSVEVVSLEEVIVETLRQLPPEKQIEVRRTSLNFCIPAHFQKSLEKVLRA